MNILILGQPTQTVLTQIRVLLKEWSDLSLHCLPCHLHLSDNVLHKKKKKETIILHIFVWIVTLVNLGVQFILLYMQSSIGSPI